MSRRILVKIDGYSHDFQRSWICLTISWHKSQKINDYFVEFQEIAHQLNSCRFVDGADRQTLMSPLRDFAESDKWLRDWTLYTSFFRVHYERSWIWYWCLPRSDISSESICKRVEKRDQVQTIDSNDMNIRVRVNDVRVLEMLTSRHRLRHNVLKHMMDIILQSTLSATRCLPPNLARRICNVANCLDDSVIF